MKKEIITLAAVLGISLAISGTIHVLTSPHMPAYRFLGSTTTKDNIFAEVVETAPLPLDNPEIRNLPDAIKEEINRAEFSIDMEVYLWYWYSSGPIAEITDALVNAASKGVQVRILIDNQMYQEMISDSDETRSMFRSLDANENIEIRQLEITPEVEDMHSKVFIFDNTTTIISSANLSHSAMTESRNIGILVKSEIFGKAMKNIFETGWFGAPPPSEFENGWPIDWIKPVVTPIRCPPWVPTTLETILNLFEMSKGTIHVPTYVLNPPSELVAGVENAAGRGIYVRIIIDNSFANPDDFPRIRDLDELPRVEVKQGDLPGNGLYHSKAVIVDGKAGYIGSANWSSSSMLWRRELGVYFCDENLGSAVEKIFRRDWESKYARYILPQPEKTVEFLGMTGAIFGVLVAGIILLQKFQKKKTKGRRRNWVAELWAGIRHEI